MGSHLFEEVHDRTQVSPLTILKAQALRDYDTLSVNSVSAIPIGARLTGRMGKTHENYRNNNIQRLMKVSRLVFELFFPVIEIYANILRAFRGRSAELHSAFYGKAVEFTPGNPDARVILPIPAALRSLESLCGELDLRELNQHRRRRRAEMKALIQRILMGLFGGIALICPVLIMALCPSQNTNLITVSLATIVFAILLAIGASDSTGKDVLAATAAYTAVLVVFFGTNSSSAE